MTEGRATLAWDGRQEGEEGGILTRQGYIHYRDFDGFIYIYIFFVVVVVVVVVIKLLKSTGRY